MCLTAKVYVGDQSDGACYLLLGAALVIAEALTVVADGVVDVGVGGVVGERGGLGERRVECLCGEPVSGLVCGAERPDVEPGVIREELVPPPCW